MKKFFPVLAAVMLLVLFVAPTAAAAPPAWGGDCGGTYHCVRYGETLFSIGRQYNVDPYYIAQVNGLANPNHIYAGQVLYIPAGYGRDYPWHGHRDYGYGYQPSKYNPRGYGNYGYGYHYSSYGYDYSGYYYDGYYPNYQRYSHTCGYYNNCY
jgi:hypothetical protein